MTIAPETPGRPRSAAARQSAAAAAKLGLACELVLTRVVPWGGADYELSGNIQLDRLFGARVHLYDAGTDRTAAMESLAESLKRAGKRPYLIPTGGSNAVGALGYAAAAGELAAQAASQGEDIAAVVHASSSGGTQAGLTAGFAALAPAVRVVGIDVDANPQAVAAEATRLAGEVWEKLRLPGSFPQEAVILEGGYAGEAYGLPTGTMREAVERCARLEGLLLDPVYSGKAMAGLLGLIEAGRFSAGETVVFLHTGGIPALFPYRSVFDNDAD